MARILQLSSVALGASCTNAPSTAILAVPSAGNVTITASVTVEISHTSGTSDFVSIYGSTSRYGGCSDSAGYAFVASGEASGTFYVTVPVAFVSPVNAAGTFSYTIGAGTAGTAWFTLITGYAVFYPS